MLAAVAVVSVQKNAAHPEVSSTNTTRIAPAGHHVATNVLHLFSVGLPYSSNLPVAPASADPLGLVEPPLP